MGDVCVSVCVFVCWDAHTHIPSAFILCCLSTEHRAWWHSIKHPDQWWFSLFSREKGDANCQQLQQQKKKLHKEILGGIKWCCFDNFRHTVTFTKYCQCISQVLMDLSSQCCCHRLTTSEPRMGEWANRVLYWKTGFAYFRIIHFVII